MLPDGENHFTECRQGQAHWRLEASGMLKRVVGGGVALLRAILLARSRVESRSLRAP